MGKSEGGMWHEARKQEKKIRVMMVDYKRRADRRRQYYERIKQDPTQFLRVYGRPCKIHWETSVALAAEGPQSMMPWQGDPSINIDRFDVRSHLDLYQEPKDTEADLTKEQEEEERQCNYERYRILVQNDCAGVSEDLCLRQIHIDELYGALETTNPEEEKKNRLADKKAAIAYTYEDSTDKKPIKEKEAEEEEEVDDSDESDFEMDLDNTVDIYNITIEQSEMLNAGSIEYGMAGQDYANNLLLDKDEAEALKLAKIMEEEKAQFSGRRSRRERRAFKEKRMKDRTNSPPSYAAKESPKHEPFKKGRSSSRSRSKTPPTGPEQFSFISSFGADGEEGVVQGPMLPPHLLPQSVRNKVMPTRTRRSRSRSTSRERGGRLSSKATKRIGHLKALRGKSSLSRSRSRSKSRSRSPRRVRSRSPHRARSRSRDRRRGRYYYSRSRSRSKNRRHNRRSRSSTRSRGRSSRSHRSRSYSRSRRSYSRSRSYSSRSRSRSRSSSYSRSKSRSYSRSASRSPEKVIAPVLKRYRRDSLSSKSSNMEDSEDDAKVQPTTTTSSRLSLPKFPGKKESAQTKLTAAEKMKLKMQKALKRQLKADILARHEKEVKITQERQDREDELRAIAIQMRRREREKRHKDVDDSDPDDTPVKKKSKSRSRSPKRTLKRSRSRSRSSKDRDQSRGREPERDRHRDRDQDTRRDDRVRSGRPPPSMERGRPDPPRDWRGGRDDRDRDCRYTRDRRESWSRGDPRDTRDSRYDGRGPRDTRDTYGARGPRDSRGDGRDGTNGQGYRSSQGQTSKRRSPSPPRTKLVDY